MRNIKHEILKAFHEHPDQFISGEALSRICNCSRTAVWKHIEELRQEGYRFEAVRRAGYRLLAAPDVIKAEEIQAGLATRLIGRVIHAYDDVTSTQLLAHEAAGKGAPEGTIVIAERQTAGKGRLGRAWHSPKGTGIWMSLIIRPSMPLAKAPQLTLLTAVSLAKAIQATYDLTVQIKWPNDLLYEGKKFCGILTELNAESDRINYLVIGIGINVNTVESDFPEELKAVATSLRIASGKTVKRAELIQSFCRQFETEYEHYLAHGFERTRAEWESLSMSLGRMVTVRTIHTTLEGKAVGLDPEGVLIVQDAAGRQHKVYSADIDYRANS
ncbi:biotin--[acetyl-CoA-carboxylase] ligase [Brevibacillus sp. SYP-B805]|uniref:biotin--[acetyl-CoA-carboxylase] ligase n=1 Tax=Brevibacillus sp. SYP-B805 TaxID=1578199 RepID=UPI0013E9A163|nr:biotin--[acetyl-CoA-carboxylase] ligase [Brevibacillus sp. SYP-B805]NGQ94537.1 biotin--[acetyl-CoA-carboxylase] ligase [Brevibacillus sp. SYP-B805]